MALMDQVAGLLGRVSDPRVSGGLLAASQALLEGGSKGQNLGLSAVRGARAFNDASAEYEDRQAEKEIREMRLQQLRQQQIAEIERRAAIEGITDENLRMLAKLDPSGASVARVMAARLGGGDNSLPASIQEFQYGLANPDYMRFLDGRSSRYSGNTVVALPNGGFGIAQTGNKGGLNIVPIPGTPAQFDPSLQGQIAGAEAQARVGGQLTAEASAKLPAAINKGEQALREIAELNQHPGLKYAVGGYSLAPTVPGTPQADAVARIEQLQGATFLQAFESLKGGGAITKEEGEKATVAIARLQRSQSQEAFREALGDLAGVIQRGIAVARSMAAAAPPAATPTMPPAGAAPSGTTGGWSIRKN